MIVIQSGFVDVYGGKWKDCHIEHYNRLSEEIESKEKAGFNVEWLKDSRHRFYVAVAEVYLEQRKAA